MRILKHMRAPLKSLFICLRRRHLLLVLGLAIGTVVVGLSIAWMGILPRQAWLFCLGPALLVLPFQLRRWRIRPTQTAWLWLAIAASILALVAQFPRSGGITIEIHSVGRISARLQDQLDEESFRLIVQSDLVLVPVDQSNDETGLLSVSMPSHYPPEDTRWLSRPPTVTIGFLQLEEMSNALGNVLFEVGVLEGQRNSELSLTLQLPNGSSDLNNPPTVWREHDGIAWFESKEEDSVSCLGNQSVDFLVTGGPVLLIPFLEHPRAAEITHDSEISAQYVHVENLQTEGPSTMLYWEDLTSDVLSPGSLSQMRVWKELALWRDPFDPNYGRCINYGATYGSPFLIIGSGCRVEIDGSVAYSTEEPFAAVFVSNDHWLCFRTHGVPYVSLVQVLGNSACECLNLGFRRSIGTESLPIQVMLEECTGILKHGAVAGQTSFSEYDEIVVSIVDPSFEPRAEKPGQYVFSGQSQDIRLNGYLAFPTAWEHVPAAGHWAAYGLLTLLWLPILRKIQFAVWPSK